MSAPTRTFEHGGFDQLDTSSAIAVGRVLSDDRIITDLERQFDPELTAQVSNIAHAHLHASIDAAYPKVTSINEMQVSLLAHSGKVVPGYYEQEDVTMPPDAAALAAEPEIANKAEARDYTPEESTVVLVALRKAAKTPGYRRQATEILSQTAPSRAERVARRMALKLGVFAANHF